MEFPGWDEKWPGLQAYFPDACGRVLFPPWLEASTPSRQQSWEMQKRQVQGGWLEFPFTLPGAFLCSFPSPLAAGTSRAQARST